jgi:protein-S-isoprenylcysteine O-methyltransferase Ste14
MLSRIFTLIYGALCYLAFFATFLYAVGFIGNVFVPKAMDSGRTGTLAEAVAIDAALLALFAIQHSVMARQWFKRAWTAIIPPAAERSTYLRAFLEPVPGVALLVLEANRRNGLAG